MEYEEAKRTLLANLHYIFYLLIPLTLVFYMKDAFAVSYLLLTAAAGFFLGRKSGYARAEREHHG